MKKMNEKELEQFIHSTLRSLPDRSAPGTLEARVLAEVERRATIPWYHKSWAYWPAAVRAAFLAVAAGVSGVAIIGFFLAARGVDTGAVAREVGGHFTWFTQLVGAGRWLVEFAGQMIDAVPAPWLYGGLAAIFALYAFCFGIGAAAYRVLYRQK